ncbi:IclR family transcriptional regulator [Pseudarthrobacter sp. YAF2]|uniref:IclR family transcriptional regulator n=1 Tax=Pseudarthrobacter sp. YAF2 TaxID=3233078 RepID=UPI003F95783F
MSGGNAAYTIESLARGLSVLKGFSPARYDMSLAEIAETAQVTKATAFRIAHTLTEYGFLMRIDQTKLYRLGPTALSVGLETVASMTLPIIAEPALVHLRDRTGETVQLAVPDQLSAVIVGRYPSRRFPPNTVYIGHRVPIYAGSLGRAMLSALEPEQRRAVLAECEIRAATPRSRTSPEAILQALEADAQRGWSLNDQETTVEHRSLAAPLLTPSGQPAGAVNVTVSAQRITAHDLVGKYADAVVQAAQNISGLLPETFAGRQYVA